MPAKKQNYLAFIGDLVGSRSMPPKERVDVQKRFQSVLDQINKDFKNEIASLFLITAGDETQGILKRLTPCYDILRQIQIGLKPTEIVFGLGYGNLTTAIGEYAVGADGPAFYMARQALTEAKKERRAYGKSIPREVRLHSGEPLRDDIVNALFLALAVIKSRWTDKQAQILNLLETGKNPTEVSNILDIPLSHVSRTVDSANFREFEILVNTLKTFIENGSI